MTSTVSIEGNDHAKLFRISHVVLIKENIVDDSTRRYFCEKGHHWTIDPSLLLKQPKFNMQFKSSSSDEEVKSVFVDQRMYMCKICIVTAKLTASMPKCVAITSDCNSSEYIFECKKKHRFSVHNPFELRREFKCPCCEIEKLSQFQVEFYKHLVHYDQYTVMRFHCLKCNVDDFGNTLHLRKSINKHVHTCGEYKIDWEILMTTRKAFEHLLSVPCDDQIEDLQRSQPNCYSKKLKIAVFHLSRLKLKYGNTFHGNVQEYCNKNNIELFEIPAVMYHESEILRYLIKCLIETKRYTGDPQKALITALTNRDIIFNSKRQFINYDEHDNDDDDDE